MTASLADAPSHAYALLLTQIVCKRCVGKVTAASQASRQELSLSAVRASLEFSGINRRWEGEPAKYKEDI